MNQYNLENQFYHESGIKGQLSFMFNDFLCDKKPLSIINFVNNNYFVILT